ncbi:MAG: enoyl-CoA hydratase-related protein [Ignavibacteriales bacterium]
MVQDGSILSEVVDGVGIITLNRPEKLNAMHARMLDSLLEAVLRMRDDPAVGCVVLTGAGRGFCSGGDLANAAAETAEEAKLHPSLRKRPQTAPAKVERLIRIHEASIQLHDMAKPTIAMINGPCAGAGFSLAGACDLRIAGASAVLTSAFAKAGVSGDYGGSYFWSKIAGTAKVRELYLLSEKISAADALAQGLVNRVYPDEELRPRTMEIARSLAAGPGYAYGLIKRNLALAEYSSMEDTLRVEAIGMVLSGYERNERAALDLDAERFADQLGKTTG